ncbi:hypothetical protein [Benzoatithermus flavus]|uniref:Uncharacterized protein n=1 Tax=Benzoatithermus flavus TaxID=3108223 RepID=A0ABU8XV71_9PROT
MPVIIFLLLAILVAQFGFWDTLQGILGAAAMLLLFVLLALATLVLIGWHAFRRLRRLGPMGGQRPPSVLD